ncbi:hypothetical protein CUC08_Gglean008441 [Alternaria sp. MG1]|uniref:Uncharacterized protein n=1 Tax=Alternaria tenuissima TaxID=119927 RepID=A0ABY0FZP2_9PLEO|nr:hypothetical protein AALT_g5319 [Alternaria alternata]RII07473.1 hypothetical protein CUC08_Gglean008441 [Alternaria sp. MG1]RYN65917.1 hypothetical protein AA0118_g2851 [Alternaria tenuissima]RYN85048.1 hypothetical protein AA0120_g9298 [Alternaria tenuissima]RYN93446.1 hypothetical protein AA0119_g9489 [Alternaria tenuissima]
MFRPLGAMLWIGAVSGMPTSPNLLSARQDETALWTCRENTCTDCPFYFSAGTGWPDCPYYTGDQLTESGFPPQENGQIRIYIDVPPQEDDCRTLIRTPVRPNDVNCGGNIIIAEGATCAAITIDNTFIASRCCGLEECTDAGAPGKRDTSRVGASSSGILMLHDLDGNIIEPKTAALLQHADDEPSLPVQVRSAETQPTKFLTKRDCDGFQATRGPFQSGGTNYVISDVVTCTPTESCQATLGEEVTEETTFSTEVSVSDPLGIVSASVGFEFSESVTQSFEGSYTFGPGERGYVVFIPWITCVEGYFTGDCSDEGVQTTICGGESSGGAIKGEQRPVIIRG